ncbi:Cytoplasmic glyoxalase II [Ascosphaera pollenicola]|nr:Cytoplasmic glyoxalase II [Ascosphaera pollenicola]
MDISTISRDEDKINEDEIWGEDFHVSASRPSGSTVNSLNYDSQQSRATNTFDSKDASSRTNISSRDSRSSVTGHSQRPIAGNGGYGEERLSSSTQYYRDSSRKPSRHHGISSGPTPMPKPNATNTEKYEVASGRHEHMHYDEGDDENAFAVLMRMPILLPIGIFLCFYALFLAFFLLIFPLRFCPPSEFVSSRVGFRGQVCRSLGPVFCFSMRVVYASETSSRYKKTFGEKDVEAAGGNGATRRTSTMKHATSATTAPGKVLNSTDSSPQTEMTPNIIVYGGSPYEFKRPSMLLFAGIIFPFLTVPLLNAAWIAACFWLFSIILSDFEDGRAFVLALRDCWIRMVKSLIAIKRCP